MFKCLLQRIGPKWWTDKFCATMSNSEGFSKSFGFFGFFVINVVCCWLLVCLNVFPWNESNFLRSSKCKQFLDFIVALIATNTGHISYIYICTNDLLVKSESMIMRDDVWSATATHPFYDTLTHQPYTMFNNPNERCISDSELTTR